MSVRSTGFPVVKALVVLLILVCVNLLATRFHHRWDLTENREYTVSTATKRVIDRARFAAWHYTNDPTHVCFFSPETFTWLAVRSGGRLEVVAPDIVMFQRPISVARHPP